MNMVGVDVGTYTLVVAKRNDKGDFAYKREINAFIELPLEDRFVFNMMKAAKVPLIERENVAYALGEAAVNMAYTLPSIELKRPMSAGCVNPKEKEAFQIMSIMLHSLVGSVKEDGQSLYYCVPANAINQETDADYHQRIIEAIFKAYKSETGFTVNAKPINEALALVYAELEKKAFTGIGVSCLCPGTKIWTRSGLTNIENVEVGDEVFTHRGRWRTVYDTVKTYFRGTATKIRVSGYSGVETEYEFVDNHKLYVFRNDQWNWIGCEELLVGDIVGEPIEEKQSSSRIGVEITSRNTCSKLWKVEEFPISEDMCELIGYFLGDGSISIAEGAVNFDFANHETDNIERVIELCKSIFDRNASKTKKGSNCTRVKCYSRPLVKWFKEACYFEKNKRCPFEISDLTDGESAALLRGLIFSDGRVCEQSISFYNSNSHLIHLAKRLFARCGVAASLDARKPRSHVLKTTGRTITAQTTAYRVTSGSQNAFDCLGKLLAFPRTCKTSQKRKLKVHNGFVLTKIKSIEKRDYTGEVYDLRVAEDHSFSGPNMVISNCGAGMVNVCFAMYGAPVFKFSIVNSGDWIDKQAAKATGENVAFINKEKTKVDLSKPPQTLVERAIQTQYRLMVEHTVNGIQKGLSDVSKTVRTDAPVDIVVAGGVSSPPGFTQLFKETLAQAKLPIKIGEVVRPADPLYSVARGCLLAAEAAAKG